MILFIQSTVQTMYVFIHKNSGSSSNPAETTRERARERERGREGERERERESEGEKKSERERERECLENGVNLGQGRSERDRRVVYPKSGVGSAFCCAIPCADLAKASSTLQ